MVALATLGTVATVFIAWQLSLTVTRIFIDGAPSASVIAPLSLVAVFGAIKATSIWAQEFLSARASVSVKVELRRKFYDSIIKLGSDWLNKNSIAELNLLATKGLDALDLYFAKYLPQLIYTALVTPALVMVIWSQDLLSAIALVVTLPLVPLFMILIGWATNSVQQKQLDALTTLTKHFLEVIRGLPTLRIFNRAQAQIQTIGAVSEQHRIRTMKVLRVTFLSSFALELLGSLSVALIAVSIGLRLVNGEISLLIGLFILLLAPEAFLPLRQVGAHFHAAAEGVTASQKVLDVIDEAKTYSAPKLGSAAANQWKFDAGSITAIVGPSGAGKSSIFRTLLGLADESAESSARLEFHQVSWMPQDNRLFATTVRKNITGPVLDDLIDKNCLTRAVQLAALDDLTLDGQVGIDGSQVSGGQAQRVSLARAFYRALTLRTQYLLLDEPISAIDEARAKIVIDSLKMFAEQGINVVAITHQQQLIHAADKVIEVANV